MFINLTQIMKCFCWFLISSLQRVHLCDSHYSVVLLISDICPLMNLLNHIRHHTTWNSTFLQLHLQFFLYFSQLLQTGGMFFHSKTLLHHCIIHCNLARQSHHLYCVHRIQMENALVNCHLSYFGCIVANCVVVELHVSCTCWSNYLIPYHLPKLTM